MMSLTKRYFGLDEFIEWDSDEFCDCVLPDDEY